MTLGWLEEIDSEGGKISLRRTFPVRVNVTVCVVCPGMYGPNVRVIGLLECAHCNIAVPPFVSGGTEMVAV
jgi:hypothetical protein